MTTDTTVTADPFAGTVYRDLCDAEDAVGMARFHGLEDGIAHDPTEAVAQIGRAIAALQSARARLR